MLRWIPLLLFALLSAPVLAENYYLKQVDQAEVSDQQLQEAAKQIEALEEVQLQQINLSPFHKRRQLVETDELPFCRNCHLPLPHRKNERKRTFLNMHSRFIACETCHLQSDDPMLNYRWLAYSGPHAGIEVMPTGVAGDEQGQPSFIPLPGARIAPFVGSESTAIFKDSVAGRNLTEGWESSDDAAKAKLKARLHAPLQKEGPDCDACHHRESMLDLVSLGADPVKVRQIEQNSIARFFTRFNEQNERLHITDLLR